MGEKANEAGQPAPILNDLQRALMDILARTSRPLTTDELVDPVLSRGVPIPFAGASDRSVKSRQGFYLSRQLNQLRELGLVRKTLERNPATNKTRGGWLLLHPKRHPTAIEAPPTACRAASLRLVLNLPKAEALSMLEALDRLIAPLTADLAERLDAQHLTLLRDRLAMTLLEEYSC